MVLPPRSFMTTRIKWQSLNSTAISFCYVRAPLQIDLQRLTCRETLYSPKNTTVLGGNQNIPSNIRHIHDSTDDTNRCVNTSEPPFANILIANRGEIARRISRTCRSMIPPIRTTAVYSTADSKSPHVLEADEAIFIGGDVAQESYLNLENILEAIRVSGADAVHPGYGFFSENAEFAKKVAMTGVAFIGPSPEAIVSMGDKIFSKRIAKDARVNVIPGYDGVVQSPKEAVKIAREIGYPIMIKATSGGGGKGMRICRTDDEVREGFVLSEAEAKNFFNDGRLLIEKFIERPHHIEFQVLAGRNTKGELDIICFPERECSIQRRNQKILEESPSMLLSHETRSEMVRQVKRLVKTVNYESAGTMNLNYRWSF